MDFTHSPTKCYLTWWLLTCLAIGLTLAGCSLPGRPTDAPLEPSATSTPAPTDTPGLPSPVPPSPKPVTTNPATTASPSSPPSPTSKPGSPTSSPTKTMTATITQTPTRTKWVYATFTPYPTRTPSITPTPTPPLAYLRILRPGAYSKLLSPIQMEASISPGDDGLAQVELLGEDGRTLANQRLDYHEYLNQSIAIAPKLVFHLVGVSELGRLVVSVKDRYGRKLAVTSTDLILLTIGDNDVSPADSGVAPYLFRAPVADQIIQGGIIAIRGLARPVNEKPIILELFDEQGQVLANAQIKVELPSGALSHNPFSIDLAYKITAPQHGRLVMRQESANRIPGTVALWSIPVNLQP